VSHQARQLAFELPHRPAMDMADFLVAPANADALAWIDRWPDWPGRVLVVHGPPGCGKSHLANVWRARVGAAVMTAGALSAETVPGIIAPGGCLVLEDIGADLFGDRQAETALFHLMNWTREQAGGLLLTSRRPPGRWALALADLASRIRACPAVALRPPDDVLLAAVLVKLFADRQIRVGDEVVSFLVKRIERSFAAARAAVETLDRRALAEGRPITIPFIRKIILP
jgi:chromosomal replication initiation ATPase DnaA